MCALEDVDHTTLVQLQSRAERCTRTRQVIEQQPAAPLFVGEARDGLGQLLHRLRLLRWLGEALVHGMLDVFKELLVLRDLHT